ncbi:MAG: hypothetical protein OXI74_09590 [Rhodospirillaceae bacterium]|nr:hypothetical protein [Rhodospirillaceae bacterium]
MNFARSTRVNDQTDEAPVFENAKEAVEQGLYQFWTPDQAVDNIVAQLREFPQSRDMHFWAQFPGEPIDSSSRRTELLPQVPPRVREALQG